jgi:uncharacterized membrane protein
MAEAAKTPTVPTPTGAVTGEEKLMGAIAYIGILFLIPLLAKKDSDFAQFHAKQGLVLFIAEIIVSFVGGIIPFLGWFIILPIGSLITFIFAVIGIVQAATGKYWKLPWGLGDWAEKLKF